MSLPQRFNLGIVGCGQMGTSILSGILNGEVERRQEDQPGWTVNHIFISVQSASSVDRLRNLLSQHLPRVTIYQSDNLATVRNSHVVILGCKPALMHTILSETGMREALESKILISILAGMDTKSTQDAILANGNPAEHPESQVHVVRAMPNIAAREGASITVVASPAHESDRDAVRVTQWLFNHVGKTQEIPESQFDLIGSLAGCTSAMFTVAIDGLLDQCVAGGFKRSEGLQVITQTLLGLAKLLEAGNHPAALREEVSSPGGSTIQGLLELERQGVRSAFASALGAAGERARELGRK
ncbi:hypothetical protein N7522_012069 [Penicillium canescens]|nr:hypothetical protein N7522_012069 [Penicillium canescens]